MQRAIDDEKHEAFGGSDKDGLHSPLRMPWVVGGRRHSEVATIALGTDNNGDIRVISLFYEHTTITLNRSQL